MKMTPGLYLSTYMSSSNQLSSSSVHNSEGNDSEQSNVTVRDIVSGEPYNETEIIRAPQSIIDQFDPEFINNLETIQVTAEAPWDEAGENLLRFWMDEAKTRADEHETTAYSLKSLYRQLSVTVILTTGLVFLVSSLFPCTTKEIYKYIQVIISFLSLVAANIAGFYDYGPRYQCHFEFEGLYRRYRFEIQEILATDVSFRPPKDKTIVEFRERMGNLVTSAPEVRADHRIISDVNV